MSDLNLVHLSSVHKEKDAPLYYMNLYSSKDRKYKNTVNEIGTTLFNSIAEYRKEYIIIHIPKYYDNNILD